MTNSFWSLLLLEARKQRQLFVHTIVGYFGHNNVLLDLV